MSKDVIAKLSYMIPQAVRPAYYTDRPGVRPRFTGAFQEVPVHIHNGRTLARPASLAREGFQFLRHETRDVDFSSDAAIEQDYYPQVQALLARLSGAHRVEIFDHTVRTNDMSDPQRRPAQHVHNDYTAKSAVQRTRDILGDEAEALLRSSRHWQLNFWRPLDHPVEAAPLALLDSTSLDFKDLAKADIVHPGRVGEIYEVTHNPRHHWIYYPEMTPEEGLVIRGYDSHAADGVSFTPHTAFHDPRTPDRARPRRSIEFRAMAFAPLNG